MSAPPPTANPAYPDALPPGSRLGEYEILNVLGVGGFGIVYLAFDHALEREVAVKEYLPGQLAGRGADAQVSVRSAAHAETFALGQKSFVNEARLLARFDHRSLVKVHRFWEANGTAYMVMPYYRGQTLKAVRQRMGAAPDEAWLRQVVNPLLGALQTLHDAGVYHRDIAPDNIILADDGTPVLLDFGAARRVIGDRSQNLTAILKPSYAPIEQYGESGAVRQGPWTDLYALGATLHFMVAGQPPAPSTTRSVHDERVPLASLPSHPLSLPLRQAIDWALQLRPQDRPQSVAALREVLDGRVSLTPSTQALPAGWPGADDDATVIQRPGVLPPHTQPVSTPYAAPTAPFAPSAPTQPATAPHLPPLPASYGPPTAPHGAPTAPYPAPPTTPYTPPTAPYAAPTASQPPAGAPPQAYPPTAPHGPAPYAAAAQPVPAAHESPMPAAEPVQSAPRSARARSDAATATMMYPGPGAAAPASAAAPAAAAGGQRWLAPTLAAAASAAAVGVAAWMWSSSKSSDTPAPVAAASAPAAASAVRAATPAPQTAAASASPQSGTAPPATTLPAPVAPTAAAASAPVTATAGAQPAASQAAALAAAPAASRSRADRAAERAAAREARQATRGGDGDGPMFVGRSSSNDPPPLALPSRGPAQAPALDFTPRYQRRAASAPAGGGGRDRAGFDSMPVYNERR